MRHLHVGDPCLELRDGDLHATFPQDQAATFKMPLDARSGTDHLPPGDERAAGGDRPADDLPGLYPVDGVDLGPAAGGPVCRRATVL